MSDEVAREDDVNDTEASAATDDSGGNEQTRRWFFETWSILLGGLAGLFPAVIGLVVFCDPLWRKKKVPTAYQDKNSTGPEGYVRVTSIAALSADMPQRFPVIDDQIDAWNFTPDQPIGAVYLQKLTNNQVRVFNATCPHAGCSVSCNGTKYECPCHNSAFNLNGSKKVSDSGRANPSPRGLDSLEYEIKDGEIWIEFKNFYTGKHDKKAKA